MYSELNREDFLRSRNFSKSYCVCVRVQNNAMGCGTVGMYSAYQFCIFLVRFINPSRVETSNTVFWLHSYVTVVVLVVAAVLSNLSSYVGDTIHCLSHYDSEPWTTDQRKLYSQDFCWIYGTQTGAVLTINHGCHGRSVSNCLEIISVIKVPDNTCVRGMVSTRYDLFVVYVNKKSSSPELVQRKR